MEELKALTKLRKRSDIVIKPADKGSGTVIMDYSWYVDECHRQLNDTKYYQKQSSDLTSKIHERVKEYTTRLHKNDLIDYETFKYLSSNSDPRLIVSTFSLKSTNKATLADPLYPAIATLLNAFPSSSLTTYLFKLFLHT